MSPHVGNFVQDLVEMAKATEELPQVREALRLEVERAMRQAETIQRLELKLLDRTAEIENLNATVRKLEAERDDAIGSFLEADERTHRVLDFVKTTFGNAGALIQAVEGKPEPVPQPEPSKEVPGEAMGQSAVDPMPTVPLMAETDATSHSPTVGSAQETVVETPSNPGQSEVGESPATTPQDASTHSVEASATNSESVSIEPHPEQVDDPRLPSTPYAGKLYINVPGWVSHSDWLAGGGTDETYLWREGQPMPEGFAEAAQ